jgi:hypothetical protein
MKKSRFAASDRKDSVGDSGRGGTGGAAVLVVAIAQTIVTITRIYAMKERIFIMRPLSDDHEQ